MPRISSFYGITIYMYWRDHNPPHFHAQYGEHWAELAIDEGQLLKGSLPRRALRMVEDWRRLHEQELHDNWRRVQIPEAPIEIEALP